MSKNTPNTLAKKPATNGAVKKPAAKSAAKTRLPMPPLEAGQVWKMAELNLQVGLVGKLLVHYKLAKPDAVRVANSVGGRTTVEKYLKANKAVLLRIDKVAAAKARV